MTGRLGRGRAQDGSATVELAITAPAVMVFLLFLMGIGRIALAAQAVESAANQAARAASIARTADAAGDDARSTTEEALTSEALHCDSTAVKVDTSQFATAVGVRAEAVVTVTCVLDLGDVSGVTGLPGKRTVTKTANSPIDTYRGRQP